MFKKKGIRYVVELSPSEVRLMTTALMNFRNKCLGDGKPTEDINALLMMVMKK